MEIRKLHLAAFGLFTDQVLDFDHESGGLYLIFGPNEAGKSSALRGLKALLYGISERTTDNFIHSNDQLRIGGLLKADGDHELAFVRRKGRKNTLLTPQGEVLDETTLNPFLQGVTLELFETLFGIDHAALVRGGGEILEQKGEVGQLLFSAALGSSALHSVLEQLEREADELFKPRGSIQKINAAIRAFKEKNREMREVSLSSSKWAEYRRSLSRITKDLEQLRDELATKRKELTRLERTQRILPKLARRTGLLQRLDEFGDFVVLTDDFRKRRQNATQELEKAKAVDRKASLRLEKLKVQLSEVQIREEVIQEADAIEALHQLLGSHRKAMKDRPRLEAERRQLLVDVESLLKEVRPGLFFDDVEKLRPVLNRRKRIGELANQHQALVKGVKDTDKSERQIKRRLEEAQLARRQLPDSDVSDPLRIRKTVSATAKMGQIDEHLGSNLKDCQSLEEECTHRLARLSLWKGVFQDVSSLPAPARESIDRFDEDFNSIERSGERLQEREDELTTGLREIEKQLDEIQRVGMVPTEEDLNESRFERDRAWQLLRRQWLDSEDVGAEAEALDSEHDLPDAFELRVSNSDELADRLRREADRVHKQASLLAAQSDQRQQLEAVTSRLEELIQQKAGLEKEWQALWKPCDVEPRTPREMRVWLTEFEKLRDRVEHLMVLRKEAEEISQKRDDLVKALKQELKAFGREVPDSASSLQSVLSVGEDVAEEMEHLQRRREEMDKQVQNLEHDLTTASAEHEAACAELEQWKAKWQEAVVELDLGPDALPSEANEILEKIGELFSKQDDAEKLQIRIEGVDRDASQFEAEVSRVTKLAAPEQADLPVEQSVVRLNLLLAENRATQSRFQEIEKNKEQAEEEIQDACATIETMEDRLGELCDEAQCGDPDELEAAERRSEEYQRLKSEREALEREILEAGEGASLANLEKEAERADPDKTSAEIDKLTHMIEDELEPRRTELAEMKGAEEKELSLMDGSDRAAELANEAQGILAGIRNDGEQYLRLRLAGRILRQEIERYRRENEGPLVRRASEHFSVLTRGSFDSLRVDFDEKDEPVLVGIRPAGEVVHVEGMSSGSRDQLYLALRLAALEKYMDNSEPMPFIVDDILVQFDDDRSAATLQILAEFGRKTQVILFTHHSRLVEQAKALDVETPVSVHEL